MLELALQNKPTNFRCDFLSLNPKAMHILETYLENPFITIDWCMLSMNPSIFEIDIEQTHIHLRKKAENIDCHTNIDLYTN